MISLENHKELLWVNLLYFEVWFLETCLKFYRFFSNITAFIQSFKILNVSKNVFVLIIWENHLLVILLFHISQIFQFVCIRKRMIKYIFLKILNNPQHLRFLLILWIIETYESHRKYLFYYCIHMSTRKSTYTYAILEKKIIRIPNYRKCFKGRLSIKKAVIFLKNKKPIY